MGATTLAFSKVGDIYKSTTTVNCNCNIHIEFDGYCNCTLYQKTAGSEFSGVENCKFFRKCIDIDYGNWIYPKELCIECDKEPIVGIITE